MKKQVSSQYTQLTLDFEYEASSTAIAPTIAPAEQPSKVEYHFTQADFEVKEPLGCGSDNERRAELLCTDESEWENTLAIEHDIMYGRGAYLYKQVERELAFQREQAKILRQFEAMQASMYQ